MTDIIKLARKLYQRIEWQNVPDTVDVDDMVEMIEDAIRHLYVVTGRALMFSEDFFVTETDPESGAETVMFAEDLPVDEEEYVIVTAQLGFYQKVQSDVSDLTSYTTDAMSVSHGDKPFANLQEMIGGLKELQTLIYYKMHRYHLL